MRRRVVSGVILSLGTADRDCAQFGGDEVKNDATLTKRKNAPAPGTCPWTSELKRTCAALGVRYVGAGREGCFASFRTARSIALMATKLAEEPSVQMATRVPASLLMKVKIHCVERERTVMDFVADAVREKLRRAGIRGV